MIFTKKYNTYKKFWLTQISEAKILWNEKIRFRDPKHSLFPALNWNTDEFSCAIGLANLKRLKKTIKDRLRFCEFTKNQTKKKKNQKL